MPRKKIIETEEVEQTTEMTLLPEETDTAARPLTDMPEVPAGSEALEKSDAATGEVEIELTPAEIPVELSAGDIPQDTPADCKQSSKRGQISPGSIPA